MEQGLQNKNMDVLLGGLSAQIKAQIKGTAGHKLYRGCLSGPSNETFSCIKGVQVVSVLEAVDCVRAKGTQNKSAAQFFFQDNWDRNTNNHACVF
jgi:hypothetical protein